MTENETALSCTFMWHLVADLQGLLHGSADFATLLMMNKTGDLVTALIEKTDVFNNFSASVLLAIALPTSLESLNLQKGKKCSVHIPLKCRPSNRQDFLIRIMPLCVLEMITWWKQKNIKLT